MASRQLVACAGSCAPFWSVTEVMAIGSQYLPSLAKVANALGMDNGEVCVAPNRLDVVNMLIFGFGSVTLPSLSTVGRPECRPTESTIFWMPQKSSWAAEANVMVLIEL